MSALAEVHGAFAELIALPDDPKTQFDVLDLAAGVGRGPDPLTPSPVSPNPSWGKMYAQLRESLGLASELTGNALALGAGTRVGVYEPEKLAMLKHGASVATVNDMVVEIMVFEGAVEITMMSVPISTPANIPFAPVALDLAGTAASCCQSDDWSRRGRGAP